MWVMKGWIVTQSASGQKMGNHVARLNSKEITRKRMQLHIRLKIHQNIWIAVTVSYWSHHILSFIISQQASSMASLWYPYIVMCKNSKRVYQCNVYDNSNNSDNSDKKKKKVSGFAVLNLAVHNYTFFSFIDDCYHKGFCHATHWTLYGVYWVD